MEPNILERIFDGSIEPQDVPLSTLENITENFSKEGIIGEGGSATVYKGVLRNGEVAVKRIHKTHMLDEKLFRRELNSLLEVNHKNIVRFLGFCSHTEHKAIEHGGTGTFIYAEHRERLLCFEYINNGSLKKYITDELRGLSWDTRYSMIKGICEGVQYLHMTRHIIHLGLKPDNILIDNNMVAKLTGFKYSRSMMEDSETESVSTYFLGGYRGYVPPEYINSGTVSVKYDVYSLGIIIIELVTGSKFIPNSNNVLRRWGNRLRKQGQETPLRVQQITKLVEIGLRCRENDPSNRPSISEIQSVIDELESLDGKDDMLMIEPLELYFPIEINNHISCSLELTNNTNDFFAFYIRTTSPLPYCIQPNKDIVAPRSKYSVKIILQPLDKVPEYVPFDDFIVWSTKVNSSLISEDITYDIFNRDGEFVDDVYVTITHTAKVPRVDVSLGSLIVSDTRNLHDQQEYNVLPTEAESKSYADGQFTLPPESTSKLWSSEMTDQATELQTLEGVLADANAKPVRLSYPFIKSITRNFYEEIGSGGFGVVYMGHLRTGKVAVKKLSMSQGFSDTVFAEEINCLMRTKHNNVVRFLGYCADTHGEFVPFNRGHVMAEVPQRLLCFEYVPNGNLQKYLKDNSHDDNWNIRYQIIRGICHGLNYLHGQRINHLDLKADNILLDTHLEPKITDFGLSRCFDEEISRVYTKVVRGTPGSIAPEMIDSGEITFKSDIYGLGIIIIRLLLGGKKYDFDDWHTSIETDDPKTRSCIEIAQTCVAFDQSDRPTIDEIMRKLNEIERP